MGKKAKFELDRRIKKDFISSTTGKGGQQTSPYTRKSILKTGYCLILNLASNHCGLVRRKLPFHLGGEGTAQRRLREIELRVFPKGVEPSTSRFYGHH